MMNERGNEELQARESLYGLLGAGFSYPEPELHEFWHDGSFAQELGNAIDLALPELSETFRTRLMPGLNLDVDFTEFEALYLGAFEMDLPKRSVSLYEGSYVLRGGKSELLLELKGFYGNFGLAVNEELRELEDHLTAELEFMQFLTMKLVQPGIEQTPYILAQRDFLERHLAPWMARLQSEVRMCEIAPFYVSLTDVTSEVVAADLKWLLRIAPNVEKVSART